MKVLEREFCFFSKAKRKQDKVWKWENALSRLLSQRKTKANRLESDRSTKKVQIRDENSNSDVEMQGQAHEVVMQEQNQETGATGPFWDKLLRDAQSELYSKAVINSMIYEKAVACYYIHSKGIPLPYSCNSP